MKMNFGKIDVEFLNMIEKRANLKGSDWEEVKSKQTMVSLVDYAFKNYDNAELQRAMKQLSK